MISIIVLFAFGFLAGIKVSPSDGIRATLERLTFGIVLVLLLVLGILVGRNDEVFTRLPEFGLVSLMISGSCMLGSAACAGIAYRLTRSDVA